jgi:hypothetical protein
MDMYGSGFVAIPPDQALSQARVSAAVDVHAGEGDCAMTAEAFMALDVAAISGNLPLEWAVANIPTEAVLTEVLHDMHLEIQQDPSGAWSAKADEFVVEFRERLVSLIKSEAENAALVAGAEEK